jgi:predicted nuclease with TOPRIM domain
VSWAIFGTILGALVTLVAALLTFWAARSNRQETTRTNDRKEKLDELGLIQKAQREYIEALEKRVDDLASRMTLLEEEKNSLQRERDVATLALARSRARTTDLEAEVERLKRIA